MSIELQKRTLGLACHYPESASKISALAKEEWFGGDAQSLFKIIKESVISGDDILNLATKAKLTFFYSQCLSEAGFKGQEENLCESLREWYLIKQIKLNISDWNHREIIDPYKSASEYTDTLLKLISGFEGEKTLASDILEEYEEVRKEYGEKRESGQNYIGLETGYNKFDDLTDGIRKGHLIVCGGYTSTGKTMFALNLTKGLLERNKRVAFYSLEMTTVEIMERLLGIYTGISSRKITKGELSEEEKQEFQKAKEFFIKNDLSVHGSNSTLEEILMSVKIEMMTRKVDCLFIDYGQLIKTNLQSEYESMSKIAVDLQTFAKRNKVPIFLLSQISNESVRNTDSPVIGFKGSGAIAASADLALELRTKQGETKEDRMLKIKNNEPIEVVLAVRKNRHGKVGEIDFVFDTKNGQFKQDNF